MDHDVLGHRSAVLLSIADALRTQYVDPELGARLADVVLNPARGEAVLDDDAWAQNLTTRLRELSGDGHLQVVVRDEDRDAGSGVRAPSERGAGGSGIDDARIDRELGVISLGALYHPRDAGVAVADAFAAVAEAEALVLDLRGCRGGYPEAVQFVATYLFDGTDPVHLFDVFDRPTGTLQQFWTLPYVPGQRRPASSPVFVAIGSETVSAGEALAFVLQRQGRATVVGDRSAGLAHPGDWVRIDRRFVAFVPSCRSFDPDTGKDWEGVGIQPDVQVAAAEAIETIRTILGVDSQ